MVLAWENLWRFLWCWLLIFILLLLLLFLCHHLSMIFILLMFYLHLISRLLRPMKVSTSSWALPPTTFDCLFFFIYHERYSFEWTFFTHGCFFTLRSFLAFWYNLLLSRFHWEPAVTFLKVAGLHTDPWNKDPVHLFVWFTVIHNLPYILSLYLCMSILQKVLLVVKTLIRSAAIKI